FAKQFPGNLHLDHLLHLPDARLAGPIPLTIDPDRIVDARYKHCLADRIVGILEAHVVSSLPELTADPCDIHQFFADLVDVVPSVDAVGQMARKHFTRLSSGLATWSRRLDLQPHRLRVLGTAGSGKTQLALQELRDAHARGRRAMYVC